MFILKEVDRIVEVEERKRILVRKMTNQLIVVIIAKFRFQALVDVEPL